jgi:hypothetical protein
LKEAPKHVKTAYNLLKASGQTGGGGAPNLDPGQDPEDPNKDKEETKGGEGKELLPNEGRVGTYEELTKPTISKPGDNLSAHHIPHKQYMKTRGVSEKEGVSMLVEQPKPGLGRHGDIHQGFRSQDPNLAPRDALAQSVQKAREVYQKDGVYGPRIRDGLKEVIQQNKDTFPELFKK